MTDLVGPCYDKSKSYVNSINLRVESEFLIFCSDRDGFDFGNMRSYKK